MQIRIITILVAAGLLAGPIAVVRFPSTPGD
jgi:hypothetical protein